MWIKESLDERSNSEMEERVQMGNNIKQLPSIEFFSNFCEKS